MKLRMVKIMNKNLLIKQNRQLFDRLQISELSNKRLNDELQNLKKIITRLETEIENLKNLDEVNLEENLSLDNENIDVVSARVDNEAVLGEDIEYGSKIIGEIVIQAALTSNKIKEISHPNIKELVNLILGRTEVAKGEVLNIVSSEFSFDEKLQMMNDVKAQSFEYFESILKQ